MFSSDNLSIPPGPNGITFTNMPIIGNSENVNLLTAIKDAMGLDPCYTVRSYGKNEEEDTAAVCVDSENKGPTVATSEEKLVMPTESDKEDKSAATNPDRTTPTTPISEQKTDAQKLDPFNPVKVEEYKIENSNTPAPDYDTNKPDPPIPQESSAESNRAKETDGHSMETKSPVPVDVTVDTEWKIQTQMVAVEDVPIFTTPEAQQGDRTDKTLVLMPKVWINPPIERNELSGNDQRNFVATTESNATAVGAAEDYSAQSITETMGNGLSTVLASDIESLETAFATPLKVKEKLKFRLGDDLKASSEVDLSELTAAFEYAGTDNPPTVPHESNGPKRLTDKTKSHTSIPGLVELLYDSFNEEDSTADYSYESVSNYSADDDLAKFDDDFKDEIKDFDGNEFDRNGTETIRNLMEQLDRVKKSNSIEQRLQRIEDIATNTFKLMVVVADVVEQRFAKEYQKSFADMERLFAEKEEKKGDQEDIDGNCERSEDESDEGADLPSAHVTAGEGVVEEKKEVGGKKGAGGEGEV